MFNRRSTYIQRSASLARRPVSRVAVEPGEGVALRAERQPPLALAGIILASILILAASLRAQSPSRAIVARGEAQFKQSCGFCHAPDATGARGPDLVRSKIVAHDVNGNLIGEVIRKGRPDQGMPPLRLDTGKITAIAAFLHHRAHEALESGEVPDKYPLAKLLTGNAEAGKAYFQGAGGCKACHSAGRPEGHRRQVFSPSPLETQMIYPSGASSKPTVTVTLATGERLQGPLLHLDEFRVALRDGSGWYRSFSLDKVSLEIHDPLAAHRKLLDEMTQEQFHNLFAYLETLK